MCLECVFNYVVIPLLGVGCVYYVTWSYLIKPIHIIRDNAMANNEALKAEHDEMVAWRDKVLNDIELEINAIDYELNKVKKDLANMVLTCTKSRIEALADRENMWREIEKLKMAGQ